MCICICICLHDVYKYVHIYIYIYNNYPDPKWTAYCGCWLPRIHANKQKDISGRNRFGSIRFGSKINRFGSVRNFIFTSLFEPVRVRSGSVPHPIPRSVRFGRFGFVPYFFLSCGKIPPPPRRPLKPARKRRGPPRCLARAPDSELWRPPDPKDSGVHKGGFSKGGLSN